MSGRQQLWQPVAIFCCAHWYMHQPQKTTLSTAVFIKKSLQICCAGCASSYLVVIVIMGLTRLSGQDSCIPGPWASCGSFASRHADHLTLRGFLLATRCGRIGCMQQTNSMFLQILCNVSHHSHVVPPDMFGHIGLPSAAGAARGASAAAEQVQHLAQHLCSSPSLPHPALQENRAFGLREPSERQRAQATRCTLKKQKSRARRLR